ncbi:MAG: VOC family protein, partial [Candidatus Hydrogenedentes bacterium]|nr:VOC family protein [Candidatus Hydrogenedentota bacterium]
LITWAVNVRGLASTAHALNDAGLEASGPVPMSREDPKIGQLAWELLFIGGHDLGLCVPFLIDWLKCPHPSASTPGGCALESIELLSPNPDALRKAMKAIGLDLPITTAENAGLRAMLSSPKGSVTLTSAAPVPDTLF